MLHAIAFVHRDRAVVAMDRAGNGDGAFRQQQPVALVKRDRQMIGVTPNWFTAMSNTGPEYTVIAASPVISWLWS
jgi:hypothetical protein